MSVLNIALFGTTRVAHEGLSAEVNVTRTVQSFLGYLLVHRRRSHPREVLAALFWGEYPQNRAHSCLNTALWRVRRVLEPDGVARGTYLIATNAGEVGFNAQSAHRLDVTAFESTVDYSLGQPLEAMEQDDATQLDDALRLYAGDLLEGCYHDWVLVERERLRSLYVNGLIRLMRYCEAHGDFDKGVAYAQQILRYDPLREDIHRQLMGLYLELGERALALRQYDSCRQLLATELDVEPMEETQALYARIARAGAGRALAPARAERATLAQAMQQLEGTMQALEAARSQLQRTIHLLARSADDPES